MRLQTMPFLFFFVAMAIGIVCADFLNPDIYVSLVFCLISIIVFGTFQFFNFEPQSLVNRIQFLIPLWMFFSIGMTLYQLEANQNDAYVIDNNYLPGDRIVAEIVSISTGKSDFRKCEMETKYVINFTDTIPTRGRLLVFLEDPEVTMKRKDICLIKAELNPISNSYNPGEFDSKTFWKHKSIYQGSFVDNESYTKVGVAPWEIMDWFIGLREHFAAVLDTYLQGDENAVAKGLILGDRSSIDGEVTRKFGNTGAMHVLAVSGLHVAILVQILTYFFGLFSRWISKNQALLLALTVVWIYAALTGLSTSVVRSAWMFTILAGSTLLGKNYNGFNSLALSAVLILVWNPHFLYDIGFQLSYLAMIGIFLFNRNLSVLFYTKYKWIQAAWEGTMVGIAAQIMTIPLTLYYFHQFPNYFILTNLGLMVFSFLVLALGIALFSLSFFPIAAKGIAFLLSFSMFLMLWIIDFVDALPGAVSTGFVLNFWEILLLFGLILGCYWAIQKQHMNTLLGVLAIALLWVSTMVFDRFQRMNQNHVCFLNTKEIAFVVKQRDQNFCFFTNREGNPRKAAYAAGAYEKLFPGTMHYFEISQKKSTQLSCGRSKIQIHRVKGGYQIEINDESFFLATSDRFESPKGKLIYASWLSAANAPYQLATGALTFSLD